MSRTHGVLFAEVFEWAGQFRDVPMTKLDVAFVPCVEIEPRPHALDAQMKHADCQAMPDDQIRNALADLHTELHIIHPFREGNGRTTLIVIGHLAEQHELPLDWLDTGLALNMASNVLNVGEAGQEVT